MFDTFTILTLQLARAYGVGIVIVALAALLMPARMATIVSDFERSPALAFLSALFAIVLGLVLIGVHSFWTDGPAVLVSALGWVVLLKGILLMAAPEGMLKLAGSVSPNLVRLWGVVALVLGATYLAIGLTGRATITI